MSVSRQVASAFGRLGHSPHSVLGALLLQSLVDGADELHAKRFLPGLLGLAQLVSFSSSNGLDGWEGQAVGDGHFIAPTGPTSTSGRVPQGMSSPGMEPPSALQLHLLLAAARTKLSYVWADTLGSTLHACVLLRVRPSRAWLSDFLSAFRVRMPLASVATLRQLLLDMARLRLPVPESFSDELLLTCQRFQSPR